METVEEGNEIPEEATLSPSPLPSPSTSTNPILSKTQLKKLKKKEKRIREGGGEETEYKRMSY